MTQKYWLSNQVVSERIGGRALPFLGSTIPSPATVRAIVHGWVTPIPSWVLLVMVILAAVGAASAVTTRMRSELQFSTQQYQKTASEVSALRRNNTALQAEIRRMTSDPIQIEGFARSRLGMVRPTDIIVPTESIDSSNMGNLSLTR